VLECINSSLLIIGDCVKPPGRKQSGIEVESRKISRFADLLLVENANLCNISDLTNSLKSRK